MKVDTRKPVHWLYLFLLAARVACAIFIRPFHRRRSSPLRVLLYGHKLGGNLLALYRHARSHPELGIECAFLSLDPEYGRELALAGEACVDATSPACIRWLASASALVSDHGLHALAPMLWLSDLKFFDVWHGIPFKGFDAEDFRTQHHYDEVWVASPLLRTLYVERFGFDPTRVVATGYARTDRLVRRLDDTTEIRKSLPVPIPAERRIVLFAPTWQQDDRQRRLWPFGQTESEFLGGLSAVAAASNATILVRTHLNSGDSTQLDLPHVAYLPYANYPDTEALLLISDVVVCDWSSLAFDFLLLDRPAVFLDVPPPFAKGFSLGPEYRYGKIVSDMPQLADGIRICLESPDEYFRTHGSSHATVKEALYMGNADGMAAGRCFARLDRRISCVSSR